MQEAPHFNPESAFQFINTQVSFGPRVPNSIPHQNCAKYLIDTLTSFGAKVLPQKITLTAFDGTELNVQNIIASFNPELQNRILLCAHWDTRPWADQDENRKNEPIDGANDGASGVGVILEIARNLQLNPPPIGIDIVLFDAEDYGDPNAKSVNPQQNTYCLGSKYWSNKPNLISYKPKYGILLDMVGVRNATFKKEAISTHYASRFVYNIWNVANRIGYADYFVPDVNSSAIIDDHLYVNQMAGIPCLNIVHQDKNTPHGFWKHWHTHNDNIHAIYQNTLKAVGQTLLEVIYCKPM